MHSDLLRRKKYKDKMRSEYLLTALVVAIHFGNVLPDSKVNYIVQNVLKDPKFQISIHVGQVTGMPFIRFMETAADMDPRFKFSGDYYPRIGYFISTINKLSCNKKQCWEFIQLPKNSLLMGVSTYVPFDGDSILFNFTSFTHDDYQNGRERFLNSLTRSPE